VSTSAPILVRDRRLGAWDVLVLSAWCGLAGGLLEVVTRVVCRYVDPTNWLYMLSRHFVWLAPLSSLLLFSTMGLFLALGTKLWPRRGAWFFARFICFWAVVPTFMDLATSCETLGWFRAAQGRSRLTIAPSTIPRDRVGRWPG
jgi:hypothetical protein